MQSEARRIATYAEQYLSTNEPAPLTSAELTTSLASNFISQFHSTISHFLVQQAKRAEQSENAEQLLSERIYHATIITFRRYTDGLERAAQKHLADQASPATSTLMSPPTTARSGNSPDWDRSNFGTAQKRGQSKAEQSASSSSPSSDPAASALDSSSSTLPQLSSTRVNHTDRTAQSAANTPTSSNQATSRPPTPWND
ncbi:hypothetical protein JYU14_04160 [Simkania negevensis]|uniref:Uncharacterized protein n=1 Tax=Simkania negevensis TaxID=83561 RepID=A0ABS3AS88_9BACT|nr:hypothetical protein [Simkania negevensis]